MSHENTASKLFAPVWQTTLFLMGSWSCYDRESNNSLSNNSPPKKSLLSELAFVFFFQPQQNPGATHLDPEKLHMGHSGTFGAFTKQGE